MKIIKKGHVAPKEKVRRLRLTCIGLVHNSKNKCGAVFEVTENDIEKVPREHSRFFQHDEYVTCLCCKTRMRLL